MVGLRGRLEDMRRDRDAWRNEARPLALVSGCAARYRRWPMAIPKLNAFWRIAPGVRFIAFEILTTGVLLFECALRSRTCSFVQATRIVRLAIKFILFERLSLSTSQRHDKHFKAPSCLAPQQTTRHVTLPGSITCHSANASCRALCLRPMPRHVQI
jgi:hypothetical protein